MSSYGSHSVGLDLLILGAAATILARAFRARYRRTLDIAAAAAGRGASKFSASSSRRSVDHLLASKKSPLDNSIPTAQATALMRFLAPAWRTPGATTIGPNGERFGEDAFAHYFLTKEQRAKTAAPDFVEKARAQFQLGAPGLCNFLWQRTRVLDSEIFRLVELASGSTAPIRQLVLLGAGYDTRSYRFDKFCQTNGVQRFEVDLPQIQADKREMATRISKAEAQRTKALEFHLAVQATTFVPLDLSQPKAVLIDGMRAAGYTLTSATIFVWEGVTAYLEKSAVAESLEFMHDASPAGSALLATFVRPKQDDAHRAMERQLAAKNEPHKFYPTPEEFAQLLEHAGWTVEKLFTPEVLDREYATPDEGSAWPGGHVVLARRR